MNDTCPAIALRFRRLIMTKSREERLVMGCSMYDTAKQIVKSALIQERRQISPREIKQKVFLRFYGRDFNQDEKNKISASIT